MLIFQLKYVFVFILFVNVEMFSLADLFKRLNLFIESGWELHWDCTILLDNWKNIFIFL